TKQLNRHFLWRPSCLMSSGIGARHGKHWSHYDDTQDDPTSVGVSHALRRPDFADQVCTRVKLWRKVSGRSYDNEKTSTSCGNSSFDCGVDGRLRRWITNRTATWSPVSQSVDPG